MNDKKKTEYKAPKYFAFLVSIMPQLEKLSNEQLGDFIKRVMFFAQNGYQENPYPEDSRMAVYFETFEDEIKKSIWACQQKSKGGTNSQKKQRESGMK